MFCLILMHSHLIAEDWDKNKQSRQTEGHTGRHTGRQRDRQTDRQRERQRDRQADRQTDRETDRQLVREKEEKTGKWDCCLTWPLNRGEANIWGGASANLKFHLKCKSGRFVRGALVGPCWIYLFLHVWRWLCTQQQQRARQTDRQTVIRERQVTGTCHDTWTHTHIHSHSFTLFHLYKLTPVFS